MTIHPPLLPFVRASTTLATTPSPSRTRIIVPIASASKVCMGAEYILAYNSPTHHAIGFRRPRGRLRDHRGHRRRRNGRGLSRPRHEARRDVAIKVLPDLFGRDPERLARFEREAQTLASLSHPNVAQVYGLVDVPPEGGSSGHASTGLVMELVEGEDLAQQIAGGPIPIADAGQV